MIRSRSTGQGLILRRIEMSGLRETAMRLLGSWGGVFRYAIVTLRAPAIR